MKKNWIKGKALSYVAQWPLSNMVQNGQEGFLRICIYFLAEDISQGNGGQYTAANVKQQQEGSVQLPVKQRCTLIVQAHPTCWWSCCVGSKAKTWKYTHNIRLPFHCSTSIHSSKNTILRLITDRTWSTKFSGSDLRLCPLICQKLISFSFHCHIHLGLPRGLHRMIWLCIEFLCLLGGD